MLFLPQLVKSFLHIVNMQTFHTKELYNNDVELIIKNEKLKIIIYICAQKLFALTLGNR